jgi:hypothetical protein
MKKLLLFAGFIIMAAIIWASMYSSEAGTNRTGFKSMKPPKDTTYIVLAWNDLGMHCANKNFNNMCILPPYNNQKAQVIKVGTSTTFPEVMTSGYHVTYEIPGNTYSVGKTDFWTYANAIFGVTLANNIGLTGVGLTGTMSTTGNYFHVEGIPITPYPDSDLVNEHPFQLTLMKAYNAGNTLLATTQSVIPVSGEISCVSSGCHSSEQNILDSHESVTGFDPNVKPIFCAGCHQDNALGTPGTSAPVFSDAIHSAHGSITNDCFKCHPGPVTQCFRDTMHTAGTVCQDCHGSVSNVGQTVSNGRQPWLEEPDCGAVACHGPAHGAQAGMLFKNSQGHGGMFCSACHGSPHAIQPTTQPNDNVQNISLQGFRGTLRKCTVCHGVNPTGAGPHGIYASVVNYDPTLASTNELLNVYPNPVTSSGTIPFNIVKKSEVNLALFNSGGQQVKLYLDEHMAAGSYKVDFATDGLTKGVYYCILKVDGKAYTQKIAVL